MQCVFKFSTSSHHVCSSSYMHPPWFCIKHKISKQDFSWMWKVKCIANDYNIRLVNLRRWLIESCCVNMWIYHGHHFLPLVMRKPLKTTFAYSAVILRMHVLYSLLFWYYVCFHTADEFYGGGVWRIWWWFSWSWLYFSDSFLRKRYTGFQQQK